MKYGKIFDKHIVEILLRKGFRMMTTQMTKDKQKNQFLNAMAFRHATKVYDDTKKISDEDFQYILEAGRLSPSSIGSEPWKFLVIQDQQLRERLMDVASGAVEKLRTASHFVIILARKGLRYDSEYIQYQMRHTQHFPESLIADKLKRYKDFQTNLNILDNDQTLYDWASKQTYIALANMMTAAAFIGIDSTPMEGFHRKKLDQILFEEGLMDKEQFSASVLVSFGYRKEDPKRPKTRKPLKDIVTWV